MPTNTTRWSPDTCGCQIDYEWDTDTSEADRVHAFQRLERACPAHALKTPLEANNASIEENRRKNIGTEVARSLGSLDMDLVSWTYSSDDPRVLTIDTGGQIAQGLLNNIQSAVDLQFGPNLVVIL